MSQALIERTFAYISPTNNFDEAGIKADLQARGAISGSQIGVMLTSYQLYFANDLSQHEAFCCKFFVTAAQDPNYTSQLAAIQAAFPAYTVVTWSEQVVWGV